MILFVIENNVVKPTRESLMIYPFADIWNRDKSAKKDIATKEIAYIEFFCSLLKTNPYAGYTDDQVRREKIIAGVFRDFPNWTPNRLVMEGVAAYLDFRNNSSPTIKLFTAALGAMGKLQNYLETVDMRATTRTGGLVNKPSDIINALTKLNALFTSFKELEIKVQQEALESTKTRGNRSVNYFEK